MHECTIKIGEKAEQRAYSSLVEAAEADGFRVVHFAGLTALLATAAPRTIALNRVIGWGTLCDASEETLAAVTQLYRHHDLGFGIDAISGRVREVDLDLFRRSGFRRVTRSQVLIRDLASSGREEHEPVAQPVGLDLKTGASRWAGAVADLSVETFHVPAAVGDLLRRGLCTPHWRSWVVLDRGLPVGAALAHADGELAWIGWTSVRGSHRGRGIHSALVSRQLADLAQLGVKVVVTDTAIGGAGRDNASLHNMRKLGFRDAYIRETFVTAPARVPARSNLPGVS